MRIKTVFILLSLSLAILPSLQAQTFTNTSLARPNTKLLDRTLTNVLSDQITNRSGYVVSPEDLKFLRSQGWSDAEIRASTTTAPPPQQQQATLSPTPSDLKNALIYVDNFLGGGKTGFPADIISIKKVC